MSFRFSAERLCPSQSSPAEVGRPQVTPGAGAVLPADLWGPPGCGLTAPRVREAGILPFPVLGSGDAAGAATGSRPLGPAGPGRAGPTPAGARGPAPGLHWAPVPGAVPPALSPAFKGRPAPSRPRSTPAPGKGRSLRRGGHVATATRPYWRSDPGPGAARPRLVGSAAPWTACSWRRWPPPWSGSSSAERYVRRPPQPRAVVLS